MAHDILGHAAKNQPAQPTPPMRRNDYQVAVMIFGITDDRGSHIIAFDSVNAGLNLFGYKAISY